MNTFNYYNQAEKCFKPIPGKVYIANLPIAIDIPALRDEVLIVHHDIHYPSCWAVTHAATGTKVVIGSKTRKSALERAERKLLSVGNEGFLNAIAYAKNIIETQKD